MKKTYQINETAYLDVYLTKESKSNDFILIFPGGGYVFTSPREGEPIAHEFNLNGYHCAVLWYTTQDKVEKVYENATIEAALALYFIRTHASEWNVNIDRIGVCGFSAGGNLALQIGTHWRDSWLKEATGIENEWFKVDFIIASYPMISKRIFELLEGRASNYVENPWSVAKRILGSDHPSQEDFYKYDVLNYINEKTPPMFIWHTFEDELVSVRDSLDLANKLQENGVPFELHIFEKGRHGLALATEETANDESQINQQASNWFALCVGWLEKR